jgi:Zn-dependent M28 family amino/carboxypeptidase
MFLAVAVAKERAMTMILRILSVLFPALAVSAVAGPSSSPISKQRIRQDVRALSSDEFEGRGPGQSAESKTLDYLVSQFKSAGLKPGGAGGSWFQDVPLRVFVRDQPASATLKTAVSESRELKIGTDITLTSHQVGSVRLQDAAVVFVGYGVKAPELGWDNYAGADLHGKVALVLANDPDFEATPDSPAYGKFGGKAMAFAGRFGAKIAAAQAAGAAAVLVIHEDAAASYPWRQVANNDRIASMDIGGNGPPSTVISGWLQREVAAQLLKGAGLELLQLKVTARDPSFHWLTVQGARLSVDMRVSMHEVVSHNVLARLPGRTRPDEMVVYGAHWDANGKGAPTPDGDDIRNGAVDNATGTAELLEVARVFAKGNQPERSVLFIAYTAEEKGLLGSEYYASHPIYSLERTAAVINLDPHVQLGRARDVELVGGGRTDLEDGLTNAAHQEGLRLEDEPHPEAGWYFRSDHYSFAKRGVPAISFRIGRDLVKGGVQVGAPLVEDYNINRYHQPKDEFDPRWTFEGSAQEATVAWRLGAEIANSNRWPGWKSGAEFSSLRAQSDSARRSP